MVFGGFVYFYFLYLGPAMWHVGWFPDQGLNLGLCI